MSDPTAPVPTGAAATDPTIKQVRRVERRLVALEEERAVRWTFGGYARCYPVLAGLLAVLSFFPILGDVVEKADYGQSRYTFGSLWAMASRDSSSDVAAMGAFVLVVLLCLLVLATFRPPPGATGLGATIAGVAALLAVLLVTKPDTGDLDPPLTGAGKASVAILILTAVLGAAHESHLFARRRAGAST
jgi:hypothetical protein